MKTACPLDCYDACDVIYKDDKIGGDLCLHLNHYKKYEQIVTPTYKGKEISLEDALLKLKEILKSSNTTDILHYRGSGNFSLMQEVTDHFFASLGATLTDGTLCDGAGEAGIIEGRGININMPISEIKKSEVVIIWGRNPHTTNSHLLPILKDKTVIVIDPIKTKIAKQADLHIQIKPRGDFYLAMLLSRFLHIESGCDIDFLRELEVDYDDFYELTQTLRIKKTLEKIDVSLGQIGSLLSMIQNKKLAIICGVGVQKYRDGSDIMRAIDAFAVNLGLFGKEGCGVAYLGNSKDGIISPFKTKAKRISKVDTKFENFKTVFIQGANPSSQMPDSIRVKESLRKVKNIIYFGLYENETSEVADLVIPAKDFLSKNDIRSSYSYSAIKEMPKVKDTKKGISEYDLSSYLCNEFNVKLEPEAFYINYFKSIKLEDKKQNIEEFEFLDSIDLGKVDKNRLHLITPKSTTALNSQFNRQEFVYINSSLGFKENEELEVSSSSGSVNLKVKLCDVLRDDCVMIYSGTRGVNNLTTSLHSYSGKCAVYQENQVILKRLD
ncbi:MAG: molybdopterin-dependent oxidoreductase [Campylobacterota bacterium]|nr:molybdopterin-dependent oxidoreductase [Campylobacterota bacterium]